MVLENKEGQHLSTLILYNFRSNCNTQITFIPIYCSGIYEPLSCKCGEYGDLLIIPADGRWYLTGRLEG
jgi:hypothetical protein